VVAIAAAMMTVDRRTPFALIGILFAIFGGVAESLYAVGVAHANDRATRPLRRALLDAPLHLGVGRRDRADHRHLRHSADFAERLLRLRGVLLTAAFTLFALWRLFRRKLDRVVEEREEFLAYRRPRRRFTSGCRIIGRRREAWRRKARRRELRCRHPRRRQRVLRRARRLRLRRWAVFGGGNMNVSKMDMSLKGVMTTRLVSVEIDDQLAVVKQIFDSVKFHHLIVWTRTRSSAACYRIEISCAP